MSKPGELKVIATAANQPEGELIVARLAQAGITAVEQRVSGNPEFGGGGWRYVYVQEGDLERARAVLAIDQPPFSDEEIARLSEEAGREARG
jgi:hypothetical protein